ncbi:right-handed parallel beta-helix repeat-containing protein, partial [Planctomycetota bacterium]
GLAIGELAQAATITIGPGADYDFDTIQEGIDAAIDGDTVWVVPGEYIITEPITFRGKAITVLSEAVPDETTIRMDTPADTNRGSVVVFESNETAASILDGFTITGGRGSLVPSANEWGGGGIFFNASSAAVRNCTIVQNSARYGGGVCCVFPCSPRLADCTIVENSAEENGGGVLLWSGPSLTMTNCTIRENSARGFGGGVECMQNSSVTMMDCIISENSVTGATPHVAGYGGGLCCTENSKMALTNCTIEVNSAGIGGGGIQCINSSQLVLTNCAIMKNSVTVVGGGMFCEEHSSVIMTNCIVSGNSATGRHDDFPGVGRGGGMDCWGNTSLTLTNCTITGNSAAEDAGGMICDFGCSGTVTNSIVWGNTAPLAPDISLIFGSTLDITYSNVAGGRAAVNVEGDSVLNWEVGNIDADPLFARLGYWNDEGTLDSSDDVWVDGDYHLMSQAGRWDPESQTWIQDNVTSPCIDAGDPMSPIGWELFSNGGFVNMGAYGGTPKASKSYFGELICETIFAGDINGDGQVNRADLEIMALHWTDEEPLPLP